MELPNNLELVRKDLLSICKSKTHYSRLLELSEKRCKTEEEMLEEDVLLLNYNLLNCKQFLNYPDIWKCFIH